VYETGTVHTRGGEGGRKNTYALKGDWKTTKDGRKSYVSGAFGKKRLFIKARYSVGEKFYDHRRIIPRRRVGKNGEFSAKKDEAVVERTSNGKRRARKNGVGKRTLASD